MLYSRYYIQKCSKNNIIIDVDFFDWINNVEYIVLNKINMYLLELPDEAYIINYEHGMSYIEMAKKIIYDYCMMLDFIS